MTMNQETMDKKQFEETDTMKNKKTFTHLHVHSGYSIQNVTTSMNLAIDKAIADGMEAIALTDHGNLFGIVPFYKECRRKGIKPILGMEAYVARRTRHDKELPIDRGGEHLILLAKNRQGYQNLMKLSFIAYVEGYYYRPRVDKGLLEKYREGLIALSGCLGGEICQKIMADDLEGAEAAARWYKEVFGEDYYLEVERHPAAAAKERAEVYDNQVKCNAEILRIGQKLGIRVVATNDVHFLNEEDAEAQDMLICLNTRRDIDDPNRMRYTRQEWLKTDAEMRALFSDIPEAIETTAEIAAKVEEYELTDGDALSHMPVSYADGKVQLEQLAREGMRKYYGDNPLPAIQQRLQEELDNITRAPRQVDYILLVREIVQAAREMGCCVGAGRSTAPSSLVLYCLGITAADPIKYGLFERYMTGHSSESLSDIILDFDLDGQRQVMEYLIKRFGKERAAYVADFVGMTPVAAFKDVARVLHYPLPETLKVARMIPDKPGMSFKQAYKENPELAALRHSAKSGLARIFDVAERIEGCVRATHEHPYLLLLDNKPLIESVPLMPQEKDPFAPPQPNEEDSFTAQYDKEAIEYLNLFKMMICGLKPLSIIRMCLENVRKKHGICIDLEEIPLDDQATFELFAQGRTAGIYQFQSSGIKRHLRALQPVCFEDLVALYCLHIPGAMKWIPKYVKRKRGEERFDYLHPMLAPILGSTYGIPVYDNQALRLFREIAGFSPEMAMEALKEGRRKGDNLEEWERKFSEGCRSNADFVEGCKAHGKDVDATIQKIWRVLSNYGVWLFMRSHAVAFVLNSYRMAYLKAHYPLEFRAAKAHYARAKDRTL